MNGKIIRKESLIDKKNLWMDYWTAKLRWKQFLPFKFCLTFLFTDPFAKFFGVQNI